MLVDLLRGQMLTPLARDEDQVCDVVDICVVLTHLLLWGGGGEGVWRRGEG